MNRIETLIRKNAVLISVDKEMMIFDDGSRVKECTMHKGRPLREELRSEDGRPRVGARFTLVMNASGRVYLDHASCYEDMKGERLFESIRVELKKLALHSCEPEEPMSTEPKQFRVLTCTMASFANAHVDKWNLIIGYDDDGFRTGINEEIPDAKAEAEYEVNLKNYVAQVLNSRTFAMSLTFTWTTHADNLKTLTISAPVWKGDVLLVNGNCLYCRDGASSVQLKHADFLSFVRQYKP